MTTMIDTLLAKALDYERRAAGLRLAAEELADTKAERKQVAAPQQLLQAITLRNQQRPPKKSKQRMKLPLADRLAIIRAELTNGPKTTQELTAAINAHGDSIGRDRIRQMIHENMQGQVKHSGGTFKGRWILQSAKLPKMPTVAKRGAAKKRPRGGLAAAMKSLKKATIVATILKDQGPMPIKKLSAAARKEGINGLTGLHNYVKQGFIRHSTNGKGQPSYSFLAMPPSAASEASA